MRSETRLADPRCSGPSGSEGLTGGQDAFDELLPGHLSVLVLVNAAEEVHDARLLVVHPAHVTLPPHVEVKVGELLQLRMMMMSGVNVYVTKRYRIPDGLREPTGSALWDATTAEFG